MLYSYPEGLLAQGGKETGMGARHFAKRLYSLVIQVFPAIN
jgi:hypothetical protein